MARVAGYRTWDEAWDSLFEVGHRHTNHEEFRNDLAYFCAAVRATAPPSASRATAPWPASASC